MPIVLGNTTITGLGVGGLPDGVVTAADIADGAVTTAKLAAGVGGKLLQVLVFKTSGQVIVNNTTAKIIEGSIITTVSNSKIYVTCDIAIGGTASYTDVDLALAIAYKTGASSSTSSAYTSLNNSSFSRQGVSGLNSWYASDTLRNGAVGDNYWCESKVHSVIVSPNQAAATTIQVAHWASTDGKVLFGVGLARENNYADSGSEMSLTIMEVAP